MVKRQNTVFAVVIARVSDSSRSVAVILGRVVEDLASRLPLSFAQSVSDAITLPFLPSHIAAVAFGLDPARTLRSE